MVVESNLAFVDTAAVVPTAIELTEDVVDLAADLMPLALGEGLGLVLS